MLKEWLRPYAAQGRMITLAGSLPGVEK